MEPTLSVLSQVAAILEELGIRYVLVGSLASSIHGLYRSTADIDILADVKAEQVPQLLTNLQKSFYIDEQAMRQAVAQRRSFNAIHLDSVFKVDFFIPKNEEFAQQQLQRRQLRKMPNSEDEVYVASAEDTILAKLRWYQAGAEVSSCQWTDVVGILGTNQRNLDRKYLKTWAEKLGLMDLLERAMAEAS